MKVGEFLQQWHSIPSSMPKNSRKSFDSRISTIEGALIQRWTWNPILQVKDYYVFFGFYHQKNLISM